MALVLIITYCNNPFSTREPQQPGSEGAAITPANSPENVLYTLEASFEGLSHTLLIGTGIYSIAKIKVI